MISRPLARRLFAVLLALVFGAAAPGRASAQAEAVVEQVALVLGAADARQFNAELFRRTLVAPDSVVRSQAALAVGRIGDRRGTALLVPLLQDPDSTVRVEAAFALGLLRDTAALQPLADRLTGLPALDRPTALEAVSAIARIGGRAAGGFFGGVLDGRVQLTAADPAPLRRRVLLESWRLGPDAPGQQLVPFLSDTNALVRNVAAYSAARLRLPAAARALTTLLGDADAVTRSWAVRAFSRSYADSAGIAPATAADLLLARTDDADAGVRINALRALGTYGDSAYAARVAPRVDDPVLNVQVQAAATLGELGGAEAAKTLARVVEGRGTFALRREALLALARADTAAFAAPATRWRRSGDWRERAAAAEGWSLAAAPGARDPEFLRDADGRVVAAGLQAWSTAVEGAAPELLDAARPLLAHRDAAVRSVAAEVVARAADPADLGALAAAYGRSAKDSFPEATLSALGGLSAIARSSPAAAARVNREFLQKTSRPADHLVRRWAEESWPDAAALWGPSRPVATGRSAQDYRDVARTLVVAADSSARPHVFLETEQLGTIEIELLGPEAPLTVANFLRLVNRRFFDGNRWHRVVPNFVIQDGDPRGDGWGGPGGAIRDEINRLRYEGPMLGMALSGPDTGSSQWFINLSPQPHLDGIYTIFGRIVSGTGAIPRITQGDRIRTIRR